MSIDLDRLRHPTPKAKRIAAYFVASVIIGVALGWWMFG